MLKRFALTLAAALALAPALRSQTAAATGATLQPPAGGNEFPPLTLEQCVVMALDKNFDLRIQHIETDSSANTLETARAAYDPALTGGFSHGYSRSEAATGGNIASLQSTRLSAGISQKIITGATLQLDYATTRTNPRSGGDSYKSGGLSLTVRQPLLKNFGATVNKAGIEKARLGIDRSNHALKNTVLATIRSVESAYYNLAYLRAVLEVRTFSLEVAQKLLDENKLRRATGVATNLEVLQADVGVASAQRDILTAQQNVKNAEDALLVLINPFQFEAGIGALALPDIGKPDVSFDRSYKLARDNSPALASADLAIKQSQIDLGIARRNRLPQLDLVGSAGYDATRNTLGSAITHTLDNDNHEWSIAASVTYPWGQRGEKAALANAKASLDITKISYEQLDQNLLVQVRTAIRGVLTSDESARISALASKLSEQQYELEKARYDQGLSTFYRVQDMKVALDNARIAELNANVNLRNALAELARLETSSLTHYNVQLD